MKTFILAIGAAALAITAPVAAKGGGGQGKSGAQAGGSKGGGPKAENRGGGKAGGGFKADKRGGGQKSEARRGGSPRMAVGGNGGDARADRGGQRMVRAERPARAEFKAERRNRNVERRADRPNVRGQDSWREARSGDRRIVSQLEDRRIALSQNVRERDFQRSGLGNACPPGLAMKGNGCLPPGQAKKLLGSVLPAAYASSYLPDALRHMYRDNDEIYHRYGDGYVYQVDRRSNLVNSLLPLFGGGYMVGQQFPMAYAGDAYALPAYYQPFYRDTATDYYRYNNGYVYDIDRRTGLIENIIPAMGYGYGVGDMLPASYSYYNLPYQYRDVYADSSDAYYRYAPGAIYQVDPSTNLITSVASLLTGGTGLGIGQPLPAGYSAYNVPYAYRDRYYDRPDAMYRYANGNIYQVDPTTQLITAVIDAIV